MTFGQLKIRQVPGTDAKINFIFTNLENFGNFLPNFEKPANHIITARSCIDGENYGESLTCLPCEAGFRLYAAQKNPGTCEVCLPTEQCYGANMTSPQPFYWRSSPTSTNYIKCFNPEACLGGTKDAPLGICKEGYSGIMCANCV